MTQKSSVFIGLCNPKSPSNVGSVMRAAGCYGVDSVRYTGTRFGRASKFSTDTHNVSSVIPLIAVTELTEDLPEDIKFVCVEFVEGATALPLFRHPDKAMYVFGPEDGSVAQSLVDRCDAVVYIATHGCMNLAATVNVVLYDRMAKADRKIDDDERVRQSRDVNNRLIVRKLMRAGADDISQ
jgi:tRNA(Leu) C34 or U34 (ribose-2'-O)-methylase TrmL